jgi:hypothetical protein
MLRRALILGSLCVVVAAVGSVGWAMTTANDKVIVACAKKKGGALRLVASAKSCRKTERAVTWNQEGLRGLPGPKGAAGEDGLDGENGIDGEDGFDGDDGDDGVDGIDGTDGTDGAPGPATKLLYLYSAAEPIAAAPSTKTVSSGVCPVTVPQAVNGGIKVNGLAATVRVRATAPKGSGAQATQWETEVENTGAGAATSVTAWVLCTNGTPGP